VFLFNYSGVPESTVIWLPITSGREAGMRQVYWARPRWSLAGRPLMAYTGFLAMGVAVAAPLATARAADIAVPATSYYPKFPSPAIYDWTGIYVGGHIGGGMLVDSVSQNGISPGGFNLANTGNPAGVIGANGESVSRFGGYTGRLCQFPKGGPKPKFAFVFFSCAGRLPAAGPAPMRRKRRAGVGR
jgi:hypothetical protein